VAQAPRTRYAAYGDNEIAYQVLGDGPADIVVIPSPSIPIDSVDDQPSMYRFHRRLASFGRLIRYDQRGLGLSSRLPSNDVISPAFWAEDVIAVMDAVGSEQATVFAPTWAAPTGITVAITHPERVRNLVLVNGAARALWADDYQVGAKPTLSQPFQSLAMEPDAVEQGVDVLRILAPSVADDEAFRTWWDRAGNRAASPSMARALSKVVADVDVRDLLPSITVPTLILHRQDAVFVPVGHGRYLAAHIPGAHYVELPGADVPYWVGNAAPMLDEIEEFVTGVRGGADAERVLTTIVFTDIVGSTQRAGALGDDRWHDLLDQHDSVVRHELKRFGGREVNTAGDGFVATFSSPSVAIDCAEAIVDAVKVLGVEVRVGIHAGEVEVRGNDVAGMAVHIGARVSALAGASEVFVSSTVREIVTGSRRRFTGRGEYQLKGVPGIWGVFAVERQNVTSRR
jgi:class 3 adenylate cyclase/pimeloyl-ACP methyl ester carboxylesterase